jgi:hypothetical protein
MPDTIITDRTTTDNNAPPTDGNDPCGVRGICNAVHLFEICPKTTCRRAGACRGNPAHCIHRNAKIVPEEVWDWVVAVIHTRDDGLSHEETMEALEPHKGAYLAWVTGLYCGRAVRRVPGQ